RTSATSAGFSASRPPPHLSMLSSRRTGPDPGRVVRRPSPAGKADLGAAEGHARMLRLVRHGESVANAGGVPTTDYAAIPLTDRGRAQAEAVAAACREEPGWIGLSPYLRALQTAAPLLARYPESPALDLPIHEFTYLTES